MKTNLAIALALFTALHLHAQGTILFRVPPITNLLTMMPISGTPFRASLYYLPYVEGAPPPTSDQFVITLRPDSPTILIGMQPPQTRTTPATTMPGGIAWFQVKAWEVAFGTSYEAACNNPQPQGGRLALAGTSNIVKVRTGDGNTIAPGNPEASPELVFGGLKGFFVAPCPEPSTIGFGLLGLAALALLRSRKK